MKRSFLIKSGAYRAGMGLLLLVLVCGNASANQYELVLSGGRVMDPESGLDAVRDVGISKGKIVAISKDKLSGRKTVDASELVVAPGFIDFHAHGQREFEAGLQAQDGVTTQLELEVGVYPVAAWYKTREGHAPINYGATVGHWPVRVVTFSDLTEEDMVKKDSWDRMFKEREWVDAEPSAQDIALMQQRIQKGLDEGGLGVGYGINYTAGATREEIFRMFQTAKKNDVINFVHSRFMAEYELGGSIDAIQELIADAATTGAGLHIVHIGSSGGNKVPLLLEMIDQARTHGVDVTTEVYPYTAYSTFIGAAIFDGDFSKAQGVQYGDIELPETGERLTKDSFLRIRRDNPETIIVGHAMKEKNVTMAVAHPGVIIASDGMKYVNGKAHPRGAGTYSRVLGRYVREKKALSLMDALGKMSYLPAKRLEVAVPQMKNKGRIKVGADADIVVFDADTVIDLATFKEPAIPSGGIEYVLVNGSFIVKNGELQKGTYPGRAVRR